MEIVIVLDSYYLALVSRCGEDILGKTYKNILLF